MDVYNLFLIYLDFPKSPCKHINVTNNIKDKSKLEKHKRCIPSASTALLFGAILGLLETLLLVLLARPFLSLMGVKSVCIFYIIVIFLCFSITINYESTLSLSLSQGSPMLLPAHKYLTLRSLGAPAVLLSLAMQGVFRGFKDTKTPLYATGINTKTFFFISDNPTNFFFLCSNIFSYSM